MIMSSASTDMISPQLSHEQILPTPGAVGAAGAGKYQNHMELHLQHHAKQHHQQQQLQLHVNVTSKKDTPSKSINTNNSSIINNNHIPGLNNHNNNSFNNNYFNYKSISNNINNMTNHSVPNNYIPPPPLPLNPESVNVLNEMIQMTNSNEQKQRQQQVSKSVRINSKHENVRTNRNSNNMNLVPDLSQLNKSRSVTKHKNSKNNGRNRSKNSKWKSKNKNTNDKNNNNKGKKAKKSNSLKSIRKTHKGYSQSNNKYNTTSSNINTFDTRGTDLGSNIANVSSPKSEIKINCEDGDLNDNDADGGIGIRISGGDLREILSNDVFVGSRESLIPRKSILQTNVTQILTSSLDKQFRLLMLANFQHNNKKNIGAIGNRNTNANNNNSNNTINNNINNRKQNYTYSYNDDKLIDVNNPKSAYDPELDKIGIIFNDGDGDNNLNDNENDISPDDATPQARENENGNGDNNELGGSVNGAGGGGVNIAHIIKLVSHLSRLTDVSVGFLKQKGANNNNSNNGRLTTNNSNNTVNTNNSNNNSNNISSNNIK